MPTVQNASPGDHYPRRGLCVIAVLLGLEPYYVGGLRALRPALDGELHPVAFVQVAKTIASDGREVDEHIIATFALNEAVAFATVEPLNCTFGSFSH